MNPDTDYLTDPEALALTIWMVAAPVAIILFLAVLIFYVRRLALRSSNETLLAESIPELIAEFEEARKGYEYHLTMSRISCDGYKAQASAAQEGQEHAEQRLKDSVAELHKRETLRGVAERDVTVMINLHARTQKLIKAAKAEMERRYVGANRTKIPQPFQELFAWAEKIPNVAAPETRNLFDRPKSVATQLDQGAGPLMVQEIPDSNPEPVITGRPDPREIFG